MKAMTYIQRLFALLAAGFLAAAAHAQVPAFPAGFRMQSINVNGATLHVRVGGKGPAVTLLHGYGETGDMWAPMAADLARDHTVVVPDLRGMGLSAKLYARPGAMHSGFAQFAAFDQDAIDNQVFLKEGKLAMPVIMEENPGATVKAVRAFLDGAK